MRDAELTAETTVEAIRRGAGYDMRALFRPDGSLKAIAELTEEEAWCIASIEVIRKNCEAGDGHTDIVHRVKLIDRHRYVELAARHQGMLHDKVTVSVDSDLVARLQAGRERLAASRAGGSLTPAPAEPAQPAPDVVVVVDKVE